MKLVKEKKSRLSTLFKVYNNSNDVTNFKILNDFKIVTGYMVDLVIIANPDLIVC